MSQVYYNRPQLHRIFYSLLNILRNRLIESFRDRRGSLLLKDDRVLQPTLTVSALVTEVTKKSAKTSRRVPVLRRTGPSVGGERVAAVGGRPRWSGSNSDRLWRDHSQGCGPERARLQFFDTRFYVTATARCLLLDPFRNCVKVADTLKFDYFVSIAICLW